MSTKKSAKRTVKKRAAKKEAITRRPSIREVLLHEARVLTIQIKQLMEQRAKLHRAADLLK